MGKQRLDTLLAERGLFDSRSRAAASVMAGEVRVGAGGRRAEKPGEMVAADVVVSVAERPRYVSRGGIKLENALARTEIAVAGRIALDVGASTGGFTDCLLQRGAAAVVAVDVGYGELHHRLRTDPRVHVLERTNARALEPAMLPVVPNLAVVDVSFISLTKVLPAVLGCLAAPYDVLALDQAPVRGAARARRQRRRGARPRGAPCRARGGGARRRGHRALGATCASACRPARQGQLGPPAPADRRIERRSAHPPSSASAPPACPAPRATARPSSGWPSRVARAPRRARRRSSAMARGEEP